MVRRDPPSGKPSEGFPPARGDGPDRLNLHRLLSEFPPCPGGWSEIGGIGAHALDVSPLPGGMVRIAR